MTLRMQKCHQSYVRALANCREASEEEKEWQEGRVSSEQRASEIYAAAADDHGEQCRSCRNMIRAISPSRDADDGRRSTREFG